jgi:DNA-directed RNA polymerase specialized sigma24 family protein
MKMTSRQRRRAESALHLGPMASRAVRTRLMTRDELRSAAWYGICLAALSWPGRGSFRAYALTRARWQIADELRALRRRPAAPIEADPADPRDPFADCLARDGAAAVLAGARLTDRQRAALDAHCRGESNAEIGAALGVSPSGGSRLVCLALARLRA